MHGHSARWNSVMASSIKHPPWEGAPWGSWCRYRSTSPGAHPGSSRWLSESMEVSFGCWCCPCQRRTFLSREVTGIMVAHRLVRDNLSHLLCLSLWVQNIMRCCFPVLLSSNFTVSFLILIHCCRSTYWLACHSLQLCCEDHLAKWTTPMTLKYI